MLVRSILGLFLLLLLTAWSCENKTARTSSLGQQVDKLADDQSICAKIDERFKSPDTNWKLEELEKIFNQLPELSESFVDLLNQYVRQEIHRNTWSETTKLLAKQCSPVTKLAVYRFIIDQLMKSGNNPQAKALAEKLKEKLIFETKRSYSLLHMTALLQMVTDLSRLDWVLADKAFQDGFTEVTKTVTVKKREMTAKANQIVRLAREHGEFMPDKATTQLGELFKEEVEYVKHQGADLSQLVSRLQIK